MAILDVLERWLNHPSSAIGPARSHGVVVPHDTNTTTITVGGVDKAVRPRALYFKAAGNVAIEDEEGTVVTYAVTAGQVLDISPHVVMLTGTTVAAGNIIGWW